MLQQIKKFIIVGLSATILMGAQAQAVTPSPQMIEQFKQLPKAEQQRLARQYGIDPNMLSGNQAQSQPIVNPDIVGNREVNAANSADKKANAELDFTEDTSKLKLRRFGYEMFAGELVPLRLFPMCLCLANILLAW